MEFGKNHIMWINFIVGLFTVLWASNLFAHIVGCLNILVAVLIYFKKLDHFLD